MPEFQQLQAAFDAVKDYYEANGSNFSLQTVLREAGFSSPTIYQSLIKYRVVRHLPKSLGGGWSVNTSVSLHSAILHKAISKEPPYVRNELYSYLRALESTASTDPV